MVSTIQPKNTFFVGAFDLDVNLLNYNKSILHLSLKNNFFI